MDKIQLKALAKINLGLDVLRRREDGYHEVKMIMQTIGLHDDLEIRKTKTPGIQVKTNLYYLPTNENNLVYKAAKLLMDEFQIQDGVSIQLKKRIPVAAGMAGGSSDGAAVLWGINQMYGLGLLLVFAMSSVGSGRNELSEFVSYHILGNVYRHMFSSIMNCNCMGNHLRENGGTARPGLDHSLASACVHRIYFFQ